MGIGKTFCAIAAATACKNIRRIIVLVPPHLTTKWKREVEITLPSRSVHTEIVHSVKQLQRLERRFGAAGTDRRILFVIMSHWKAKTSHYWRPAHNAITGRGLLTMRSPKDPGPRPHLPACPDCGTPVTDEQRIERLEAIKPKYKLRCEGMRTDANGQLYTCDAPLWSADNRNPLRIIDRPGGKRRTMPTRPNPGNDRRAALSDYIGKHMRGFFDLTIADELHQYKAKGSARGISAGNIAAATKRSLTLTGTLMGGQSTTIFYLLHRFSPEFRNHYGFNDTAQWRARYGFTETTTTWKEETDTEKGLQGAQSKRKDTKITIKELPGHHAERPVPHHRPHDLHKATRRLKRAAPIRRTRLDHTHERRKSGRRQRVPALELPDPAGDDEKGTGQSPEPRLQPPAGRLPAVPPVLPRRLHPRRNGQGPAD